MTDDDDGFADVRFERLEIGHYAVFGQIMVNGEIHARRLECSSPARVQQPGASKSLRSFGHIFSGTLRFPRSTGSKVTRHCVIGDQTMLTSHGDLILAYTFTGARGEY